MEEIHKFTNGLDEHQKDIVMNLTNTVLKQNPEFDVAIKYKRLTFTLGKDFYNWIISIASTKKSINLLFHYGGLLDDYAGILIAGTSKFLRKIEYRKSEDVKVDIVANFIAQAVEKRDFFIKNWKEIQGQ